MNVIKYVNKLRGEDILDYSIEAISFANDVITQTQNIAGITEEHRLAIYTVLWYEWLGVDLTDQTAFIDTFIGVISNEVFKNHSVEQSADPDTFYKLMLEELDKLNSDDTKYVSEMIDKFYDRLDDN